MNSLSFYLICRVSTRDFASGNHRHWTPRQLHFEESGRDVYSRHCLFFRSMNLRTYQTEAGRFFEAPLAQQNIQIHGA